jgi:hypothetical protein
MILTIFFAFVLLIGVSLFVAVVGSSFLRRHSTRVSGPRYVPAQREIHSPAAWRKSGRGSDYGSRYRRGFEEQVGTAGEPGTAPPPSYVPSPEREAPYRGPRETGGEGRWFLLTVVVLIVVVFSFYFGIRAYQNVAMKPRVFFCEQVDLLHGRPINASDTFTRGNVTIYVRSRSPLETDRVRIEIYRIDEEGMNLYSTMEIPVKPEWTSFRYKTLFKDLGNYNVMVYGAGDQLLNQANIRIVPDSFAYKPVGG